MDNMIARRTSVPQPSRVTSQTVVVRVAAWDRKFASRHRPSAVSGRLYEVRLGPAVLSRLTVDR
jgi:hypothetical protein